MNGGAASHTLVIPSQDHHGSMMDARIESASFTVKPKTDIALFLPASMSNWRNKQQAGSVRAGHGTPRSRGRPLGGRAGPGRMDLIASVSRSSGLEKGGDDLKDRGIQEEYRDFIEGKLDAVLSRPRQPMESEIDKRRRIDAQENILILFRKLREGIASSQRNDQFALEVYESSLYLAIIFDSPKQTTSIISALIPEVYLSTPPPHRLCLPTILLSSLHHLLVAYPSQFPCNRLLQSIPETLLPRASPIYAWITSLAASLRTRNYARFERLSRKVSLSEILETPDSISATLGALTITPQANRTLAFKALFTLLDSLRKKLRETSWAIIRSAYRELSCGVRPSETKSWLSRSLCLQSVVSDEFNVEVEDWLAQQVSLGAVRRREDVEGKWLVYKVR